MRVTTVPATLCAGSTLQVSALLAIALTPNASAFSMWAVAAGVGFGLCEASGSVQARVLAGDGAARLLSALTGTVALFAAIGPLFIVAGILGASPAPLLVSVALIHVATVLFHLIGPRASAGLPAARAAFTRAPARKMPWVPQLAPVAVGLFLYVGVETIFAGWSAVIPAEALALEPHAAAAGTSIFWVLMAVGRYATWFTLRSSLTPSAVLVFTCTFAAGFLAIAGFIRQDHPEAALVATGVAIVGLGPTYSLIVGIGLARVEIREAEKAVGLLVACGAAGGAGIPAALLSVTSHPGAPWVLVAAAVLMAVVAALIALRPSRTVGSPLGKTEP